MTRDPEARALPSGQALTKFSLAVNRSYSTKEGEKREEVTYVDIESYGKQAEIIAKYCGKGSGILVEGGKTRRPARSVRASASSSKISPSSAAKPRVAKRAVPLLVPAAATTPRLLLATRAATTFRSNHFLTNLITQARPWHSPKFSSSSPSTA